MKLINQLHNKQWRNVLKNEFTKEYFFKLEKKIIKEYTKYTIYPNINLIFNIFNICPLNKIKVVIIGTDPYIYSNQADGLAFSINKNSQIIPITLRNIFRELKYDLHIDHLHNPNLLGWAKQGVFLLNSILTVREKESNSHNNYGWEIFTNHVINIINQTKKNIVYILWGKHAIKKKNLINSKDNRVIISSHPRPLSAMRTKYPFNGSKPFSRTNNYLLKYNKNIIDWSK